MSQFLNCARLRASRNQSTIQEFTQTPVRARQIQSDARLLTVRTQVGHFHLQFAPPSFFV